MKFQANVPFRLTKMFYEKLGEQPVNKRVLVIRDLFTAMHAAIDNSVTFITDDKEAHELFNKNVASNDEFGNNDTTMLVDTEINKNAWKDFIKELSSMPKFDIAIMNPPYDGNLHLKILEKVIPVADKVVNISPIGYALDWPVFYYLKNTPNFKTKQYILKHIASCELLTATQANDMFKIGSFEKLAITTYDDKEHDIGMKLYLTDKSKSKTVFEKVILSIASGKYDNLAAHIQISTIHGNPGRKDEFDIVTPQYKLVEHLRPKNMPESDFINRHNSCNTKFMKYCNLLTRQGQHLRPGFLPYMQDYTQPWDDKRFCAYFGITGYIDDDNAVPNSEWETILNTMKEYV
jgi:hypothetical protein